MVDRGSVAATKVQPDRETGQTTSTQGWIKTSEAPGPDSCGGPCTHVHTVAAAEIYFWGAMKGVD